MNFCLMKSKNDTAVITTNNNSNKAVTKEESKASCKCKRAASLFKKAIRKRNFRHIGKGFAREEKINRSTESIDTSKTEPIPLDDDESDDEFLKLEENFHPPATGTCNNITPAPLRSCLKTKRCSNEVKVETKESRSVNFNPSVMMLICTPISEILDDDKEELSQLYWSANELASLRMATLILAERATSTKYHFFNNVYLRGLEPQINCFERQSIIHTAICCVLIVQERQKTKGTCNETHIALAYIAASKQSLYAATQRGRRDEQEVFGSRDNRTNNKIIDDRSKFVAQAA